MRITISLPDQLASPFLALVPNRERSATIARLLEQDLAQRGEIWWVNLEPMQEVELCKMPPCLVLTANTLNRLRQTVVVVPLSTAARAHPPITVPMTCQGKTTVAIIDQIRTVAKYRSLNL